MMLTDSNTVIAEAEASAPSHTAGQSILLHLAPGAAAMAVYVAAVPAAHDLGLPSIAALSLSGLVGVASVQLAVLYRHRRRHPRQPAIQLRTRLPAAQMLGWVLLEVVLAALAFALTAPLARLLRTEAFGWWPASWVLDPGTHAGYSTHALAATALLMVIGTVLVAPTVEECYFRGYLLPRMPPRLGRGAPAAHATLFAGYHLWTPWLAPTRILAVLPLTVIASRTRDIRIGILTHTVLNAVDLALLIRFLIAR
jgi:membrane protease YdiL (CAAX protease family)